jgi:hypothetical protein
VLVKAISQNTSKWRYQQYWDLAGKSDNAKQQSRIG